MRIHALILTLAAAALAACSPPAQKQAEPPAAADSRAILDPAGVVRTLYAPYIVADAQAPALADAAPWSARMQADIAAMHARTQDGDGPALDFDPIIDAQDFQLSNISATTDAVVEGSHAVVRAQFNNIGEPQEVTYDLVWEDDRWKVDNIRTSEWDMRVIVTSPG